MAYVATAFAALILLVYFTNSLPDICGSYERCNEVKEGVLNIHLIAHTHDDAGWLKTVDEYYYGSNKGEGGFAVKHIINSVISELEKDESRKFIYSEMSFLWRWWNDHDEIDRERLRKLVREGRLQIVNGGWVMSDEAVTHYSALITQMDLGLRFIHNNLGICARPTVGWQIDPFGHSSELGLQFAQMGYQGLFFGRIDRSELFERKSNRSMEMVWQLDTAPGEAEKLFTGVLYNLYQPPNGFCFDVFCNDDPIMDSPQLHGNNIDMVDTFIYHSRIWARSYQTNHVMLTMGSDFHYMVAALWFESMDKLIKYGNTNHSGVNILYSTPSCYLKAINNVNTTWPVREGDFFPYSSYDGRYWSGYYSSRPALKYMAYRANNLLQVAKILGTIEKVDIKKIWTMERAIALVQHHDAISGTSKQHVTEDYAIYLQESFNAGQSVLTMAFRSLFSESYPTQEFCLLTNMSMCDTSENSESFVINLFNPLSHSVTLPIRLPVPLEKFTVSAESGLIKSELFAIPESVRMMPGRKSNSMHELVFIAEDIPAMGLKTYFVEQNSTAASNNLVDPSPAKNDEHMVEVENGENMKLILNRATGKLVNVIFNNQTWTFSQDFFTYTRTYSNRELSPGAYTFNPNTDHPKQISANAIFTIIKGEFMTEIHQTFNSWVSQIIRVYRGSTKIEFNWMVGPVDISGVLSSEVITRYKTELKTDGIFYTDSNGRRLIKRKRNTYDSNPYVSRTIASDYYPVTSTAVIKDSNAVVSILTDRPQGASSLEDGCLELMVHRRLMTDDAKGVQEPLNEEAFGTGLVARGTHTIYFDLAPTETSDVAHRIDATEIVFAPWMSLFPFRGSLNDFKSHYLLEIKPIIYNELPKSVNILTLEYRDYNQILLRVEHLLEANNETQNVPPVKISLKGLFRRMIITKIQERTLDGNKDIDSIQRIKWNYANTSSRTPILEPIDEENQSFVIHPMQIRTFLLTVKFIFQL